MVLEWMRYSQRNSEFESRLYRDSPDILLVKNTGSSQREDETL